MLETAQTVKDAAGKEEQIRAFGNTAGSAVGAAAGAWFFGPVGMAIGAKFGGAIGEIAAGPVMDFFTGLDQWSSEVFGSGDAARDKAKYNSEYGRNAKYGDATSFNYTSDKNQIPKYATGADYIPSDDYPALLHKGEMVLTSSQAANYSSGLEAATSFNIVRDNLAKQMEAMNISALGEEGMAALGSG